MDRPRRLARTPAVLLTGLLMFAAACTGGGVAREDTEALPKPGGSKSPDSLVKEGSKATKGSTTTTGTVGKNSTPAVKPGAKLPPGTRPPTTKSYDIPNLFTKAENRLGITKDKIVMCTHAALSLAPVFNVHAEDLNVFWEYVNNDLGGIYGRKVEMTYADDNYGNNAGDAQKAYDTCRAKNPFIMFGGIGFDQIPAVRTYAERDHQLYVHHIAAKDTSKKYSFSYLASVDTIGKIAAQYVIAKHADKRNAAGILYRQSDNWEPGHKAFMDEFARQRITKPVEAGANKSASVYSTQIKTLKDAGAKVVFIWENALSAIEIIQQAKQQSFNPQWLVFPFNLETDTLKEDAVSPTPIEGIGTWPAYKPGATGGPFSDYGAEIKLYEKMQAKYGRGARDDITWMTWLGWHQVYQLMIDCGVDCHRNKIAGLLQGDTQKPILGGCGFDFGRNGHVGGWAVNIMRAEMRNGSAGWKNIHSCERSF